MSLKPWTCHSLTIVTEKPEIEQSLQETEISGFDISAFEQASGIFWNTDLIYQEIKLYVSCNSLVISIVHEPDEDWIIDFFTRLEPNEIGSLTLQD